MNTNICHDLSQQHLSVTMSISDVLITVNNTPSCHMVGLEQECDCVSMETPGCLQDIGDYSTWLRDTEEPSLDTLNPG